MSKRNIFVIPALTLVLVILMEEISLSGALIGLVTSTVVVFFVARLLPLQEISSVRYIKLATFPLYLIGQIYVAGFQIMRMILQGAKVDIVTVKTEIKSEALRVILVDSITLTPGSVLLDLDEDRVTLLWIRDKNAPADAAAADRQLKQKLERRLLKAQRDS
ncbi:MAG: Na+/H+ antiporter subunit E [Defluviitaleaceae bacterium]|nr:Na+/H+ antiporter subunit E [Defluviitaleaceae bacterium]MCL2239231.1 Na+/H+ antiporter subunit E [Defluviitaleaceae bacterium]MCL2239815.1 Na+/H+ antiporter subunit E [Defluviitaleaceae bacterium]